MSALRYWLNMVLIPFMCLAVDSEKMSKSLGNFFTIREILQKYNAIALRWFLTNSQYRQPLNYSQQSLEEVKPLPLHGCASRQPEQKVGAQDNSEFSWLR